MGNFINVCFLRKYSLFILFSTTLNESYFKIETTDTLLSFPFFLFSYGAVHLYCVAWSNCFSFYSWGSFVLPIDWEKWEGEDWDCMVVFLALTVK